MTGVASQICENPDSETKYKIESEWRQLFGKIPIWGKRNAILGDLSPYASFISYNYNSPIDFNLFEKEANSILTNVVNESSWLYETKHSNGSKALINYTVWSDVYGCNNCGEEIIFWNAAMDFENKNIKDEFKCPYCKAINSKDSSDRIFITKQDHALNQTIRTIKSVPVLIVYTFQNKRFQKTPDEFDFELLKIIDDSGFNGI